MKSFNYSATTHVLREVIAEREKQHAKWGEQNHDAFCWLAILHEETGEASQASLHDVFGGKAQGTLRAELIQVAAVAVAFIESLDRLKYAFTICKPPTPQELWESIAAHRGRHSCTSAEFADSMKALGFSPLCTATEWCAIARLPYIVRNMVCNPAGEYSTEIRDVRHCSRFPEPVEERAEMDDA